MCSFLCRSDLLARILVLAFQNVISNCKYTSLMQMMYYVLYVTCDMYAWKWLRSCPSFSSVLVLSRNSKEQVEIPSPSIYNLVIVDSIWHMKIMQFYALTWKVKKYHITELENWKLAMFLFAVIIFNSLCIFFECQAGSLTACSPANMRPNCGFNFLQRKGARRKI